MKEYYLMIEAGVTFTAESTLYKIKVGKSYRDKIAYQFLENYAVQRGFYINYWSLEVREFVTKLAMSVNLNIAQLKWVYIDVNDLVRHLKVYNIMPKKVYINEHEGVLLRIVSYLN